MPTCPHQIKTFHCRDSNSRPSETPARRTTTRAITLPALTRCCKHALKYGWAHTNTQTYSNIKGTLSNAKRCMR